MTVSAGLTKEEYIQILEFYNIKIPSNYSKIKNMANDILSNQLCKCVSTNKLYKCSRNKKESWSLPAVYLLTTLNVLKCFDTKLEKRNSSLVLIKTLS